MRFIFTLLFLFLYQVQFAYASSDKNDFTQALSCMAQAFYSAKTPTPSSIAEGQDWFCDRLHMYRNTDEQDVFRFNKIAHKYNFQKVNQELHGFKYGFYNALSKEKVGWNNHYLPYRFRIADGKSWSKNFPKRTGGWTASLYGPLKEVVRTIKFEGNFFLLSESSIPRSVLMDIDSESYWWMLGSPNSPSSSLAFYDESVVVSYSFCRKKKDLKLQISCFEDLPIHYK